MTDNYELTDKQEIALLEYRIGAKTPIEIQEAAGPLWLIEGWLISSATMLSAQPEVGKSTLAAHLAAAVANRTEWHGKPVQTDREGPVLIVASDPGDSRSWSDKAIALDVPDEKWQISTFDPNNWDEIIEYVAAVDCPLMVFDNITGALDEGVNEADPQKLLSPLTKVVHTGTSVLVLAHTSKGRGTTPLGPTEYWAWREWGLEMSGTGAARTVVRKGNQDTYPTVHLNKTGEAATGPASGSDGTPKRDRKAEILDANRDKAEFVYQNCQGLSNEKAGKRLADQFGGAPATHKKDLSAGGKLGQLLERTGEGTTTKWSLKAE